MRSYVSGADFVDATLVLVPTLRNSHDESEAVKSPISR
jgi:hypothetical protein